MKGHFGSVEVHTILGMYALDPLALPVIISASIIRLVSWVTISLVPLHRPLVGLDFSVALQGLQFLVADGDQVGHSFE